MAGKLEVKEIPNADKLEIVERTNKTLVCSKSGWRCVPYIKKKGAPIEYWCLTCNKWVKPGKDHALQEGHILFVLSPKTVKGKKIK